MIGERGIDKKLLVFIGLLALANSSWGQNGSTDEVNRRTMERRAVEAVIWGMPAVNTDLMLQEMLGKTRATVYDRITHALVKNLPRASRASNDTEVQKDADGSVDIYFGPGAPAGKESNWDTD